MVQVVLQSTIMYEDRGNLGQKSNDSGLRNRKNSDIASTVEENRLDVSVRSVDHL